MTNPAGKRLTQRRSKPTAIEEAPAPTHPPITLIVGTNTGVGKTWVSCALARALQNAGQRVIAIKAIETGVDHGPREAEDGVMLASATGQPEPREALLRFKAAVAPAIAADLEGVTIDYEGLVTRIRGYAETGAITLVEGAGGLLAPVTWQDNALDLAHSLNARVIVVAADHLGTINHTLLTLRVLRTERVPVLGVVLSAPREADESTRTNAAAISRLAGIDLVVTVPHLHEAEQAAEAVKEVAGWLL